MAIEHIIFLIIIVTGGLAVLGSYVWGLKKYPGSSNPLWGGVPAKYRSKYTASMLIAVLGYFLFVYYLFFQINPAEVSIAGIFDFSVFYFIFLLILIPSAFWMPLTSYYVQKPNRRTWNQIRAVLAVVGLASMALVWALYSIETESFEVLHRLAVIGAVYFTFHTLILDAIIWIALFNKDRQLS